MLAVEKQKNLISWQVTEVNWWLGFGWGAVDVWIGLKGSVGRRGCVFVQFLVTASLGRKVSMVIAEKDKIKR